MIVNPNKTLGMSSFFQKNGTSPLDIMYQPFVQVGSLTAGAQGINTLRAIPFVIASGKVADSLYFEVTSGGTSGAKGRVGIYAATSETNIYPNQLIVDSGEFDTTSTGIKTASISVNLKSNTLYWLCSLFGTASCSARLTNNVSIAQILGFPSTLGSGPRTGLSVSLTYAALPSTFTSGAAFVNTSLTSVGIHFA